MQAHQQDFDDFHLDVPGHASAAVVGAALAAAEDAGSSYGELLQGVVAGVEAIAALGRLVGHELFDRGWHPTAVLGGVGSAVAVGQILSLDSQQLTNAVGLAALQSSGTMAGFGNSGKSWQVGCAARNGIHAVEAAQHLDSELPDHLGGRFGVLTLMAGASLRDAQQPISLSTNNTQFKYYSTCFGTHAAITATRLLVDDSNVDPQEVKNVRIGIGPSFEHVVINPAPSTNLEAKFSVSACVALTLLGQPPMVPDFFSEQLSKSPEYQHLEKNVVVSAQNDIQGGGATIELELIDGKVLRREQPESTPEPVAEAWQPLTEKFIANAVSVIGAERATECAQIIQNSPDTFPVCDLIAAITGREFTEKNGAPK